MVGEGVTGDPFYLKFGAKSLILNRYSLVVLQPSRLAKKVQLTLIGSMLSNEPKYVAPKPLPKGTHKRKTANFCLKSHFA